MRSTPAATTKLSLERYWALSQWKLTRWCFIAAAIARSPDPRNRWFVAAKKTFSCAAAIRPYIPFM
jgi:hypothetical protein